MEREVQMAERRERILAAAREIVAEHGSAGLSMRELARKSGVTVPTVYNLIGGRDAVLIAAVEEQTARFVAGIEESRARSPVERILAVHESCVRELRRLPRYYHTLLTRLAASHGADALRSRVQGALASELARGVESLKVSGLLADWVDPAALVSLLQRNLNVVALQWASGELSDTGLRSAALYGACCVLAGASAGDARDQFAARAAALQTAAAAGERSAARPRRRR
jgi:AcrR family transcriptional regulator